MVERLDGIQKVSGSIPLSSTNIRIIDFKINFHKIDFHMPQNQITNTIDEIVKTNSIVLFMKGTKSFPQCGFSGKVVGILESFNTEFKDVNVLADEAIRQGIKKYSDWPTIPQLYINGKFIGGCDIVTELYQNGELAQLLELK